MIDNYKRKINYLRISVTDRCNLRCTYCMPEDGIKLLSHNEILSFEEITEVVLEAVNFGIDKIRLTGGEPLVRKNITSLVSMLSKVKGIRDLSMTTNALLLKVFAEPLKKAGLHRINVSLDTMDKKSYKEITRGGNLDFVLEGIKTAKYVGLNPIKINCVIKESIEEYDAIKVKEYADKNGFIIRYIRKMDIAKGEYWEVIGGSGGNCKKCNRLRLTSNGFIKPCLFNDISFDIKEMGIKNAIQQAVKLKPEFGINSSTHNFYNIGG